jgi:hypothetical protein
MLIVFLHCPLLIAPSVFSKVYLCNKDLIIYPILKCKLRGKNRKSGLTVLQLVIRIGKKRPFIKLLLSYTVF